MIVMCNETWIQLVYIKCETMNGTVMIINNIELRTVSIKNKILIHSDIVEIGNIKQ